MSPKSLAVDVVYLLGKVDSLDEGDVRDLVALLSQIDGRRRLARARDAENDDVGLGEIL